jgi:hypothetical protein
MKKIIIKADTNDADYITEQRVITDEQLELIKPVVEAIKEFQPTMVRKYSIDWNHCHNYPKGENCRTDLGEKSAEEMYGKIEGFKLFDSFCPRDEYGIHTIESVDVIEIANEIKLL